MSIAYSLFLVTDLKDRDVKGDGFKHSVYGADLCSDYAWKYAAEGNVNYEIRENGEFQIYAIRYFGLRCAQFADSL